MSADNTSIPRTTKRIGSLRFFIKHQGIPPNTGKASQKQMKAWKTKLNQELKLRETLKKNQKSAS